MRRGTRLSSRPSTTLTPPSMSYSSCSVSTATSSPVPTGSSWLPCPRPTGLHPLPWRGFPSDGCSEQLRLVRPLEPEFGSHGTISTVGEAGTSAKPTKVVASTAHQWQGPLAPPAPYHAC